MEEIVIMVIIILITILPYLIVLICWCFFQKSQNKSTSIKYLKQTKINQEKIKQKQERQVKPQKIILYIPKHCAICIGDNCDLITPCEHQFHVECFNQWIKKNVYCPICHDKNIQIVKIKMCKKCQIYKHFEISKRLMQKAKSSRMKMENHVCNMQRSNDTKILMIQNE